MVIKGTGGLVDEADDLKVVGAAMTRGMKSRQEQQKTTERC